MSLEKRNDIAQLCADLAAFLQTAMPSVSVHLYGLGTDEDAATYPYAVIAPASEDRPQGDTRSLTVTVTLVERADSATDDLSKDTSSVATLGACNLADDVETLISNIDNAAPASFPHLYGGAAITFSFASYPVQSAEISLTFTDYQFT